MEARSLPLGRIPGLGRYHGDIVGGLVSAGAGIPLAMGYGMFAFIALGNEYFPDGALAGLLTAAVVGIVCVLLGDKSAHIYAPRVITTFFLGIMLYGLAHSGSPVLKAGGLTLTLAVLFSIILLAGLFQALFGLLRLGTLIRFIPQPVMSGFQNAAALLLGLVQLGNLFGFDKSTRFVEALRDVHHAKPLSLLIAAVTIVAMLQGRRWLPKVPALLTGLAAGTVLYYLLGIAGLGTHLGPTIGSVPFKAYKVLNVPHFGELASANVIAALLPTILGGALALAVVASIDALLCTKLLTGPGEPKVDGDRLLVRLGTANTLSAALGGITGGLNIGPSRDNRAFGGRSPISALVNALAMLVTLLVLFPALAYLPCVALSAVIVVIAVEHFDPWTLRLARRLTSRLASRKGALDLALVAVVAVLSISVDIVLAVFLGIAAASLLFVVRIGRAVIRRQYRCEVVRSRKSRTRTELERLERSASAIMTFELQGALFFGSGERLAAEVAAQPARETRYVILDLRRITEIDSTGAQIVQDMHAELKARGQRLLLAAGPASEPAAQLAESGTVEALGKELVFPDLDRALEWAEDDLLRAEPGEVQDAPDLAFSQTSVAAGLSEGERAEVEKHLERREYPPQTTLFRQGDPGDELFVVVGGSASAYVRQPDGRETRLVGFGPGAVFGELALLDTGPRSASVQSETMLVCQVLSAGQFAALSQRSPGAALKLVANLGRELSYRLRAANRTIQQLEE